MIKSIIMIISLMVLSGCTSFNWTVRQYDKVGNVTSEIKYKSRGDTCFERGILLVGSMMNTVNFENHINDVEKKRK